jgi:Protein of unknown function (DUF1552)
MNIIGKKALSRRTILRGMGTALALPLLDSMTPALSALEAKPPRRFGVVYMPNGIRMEHWHPIGEGTTFSFSKILAPLEPFRDQLVIVQGLDAIRGGGVHASASTRFLTGLLGKATVAGGEVQAGVSLDQLIAQEVGREAPFLSLEFGTESTESVGSCDIAFSCLYTGTISWKNAKTSLPMEDNPRAAFERLFGDEVSTDPAVRKARLLKNRSILDVVRDKLRRLSSTLGPQDRAKLDQYLEAVRDVEQQIQRVETSNRALPTLSRPSGIPTIFEEHAKLMFDIQALAYQTDMTRVMTFMMGRELSGRSFPEIGVPEAHHPTSHHGGEAEKLAKLTTINTHFATQFAYYLNKLRAIPEGDGTLLDNTIIVFGAGISDGDSHSPVDLPIVLAGGGAGTIEGGRSLRYPAGTPIANLQLTLLQKFDVPEDKFSNSTGPLKELML